MIQPRLDAVAWNSRWRTRSVAEKMTLCCGLLGCAVVLPAWPAAPLVLIVAVVATRLARAPRAHMFRMLRVPAVFILVAAGSTAVTWDPDGAALTIPDGSVPPAIATATRALAATAAMVLLASTTPMSDLAAGMRRCGIPAACVDIITAMYRMVFLFLESVTIVHKSQTARLGYSTAGRSVRSAGMLTAAILVRSWQRGHALERGLSGRSFGPTHTMLAPAGVSRRFLGVALATVLCVAVVSSIVSARLPLF